MTGEELIAFIKDNHLEDYEIMTFYADEMIPVNSYDIFIYDDSKILTI